MLNFFNNTSRKEVIKPTLALIQDVESCYSIHLSLDSKTHLKSIVEKGKNKIDCFYRCLKLLEEAKLLHTAEKQLNETAPESFIPTLPWVVKVADRDTPETAYEVLAKLKDYGLLNQNTFDILRTKEEHENFLSDLDKTIALVEREYNELSPEALVPIIQQLLLFDKDSLLDAYVLLGQDACDSQFDFQKESHEALNRLLSQLYSRIKRCVGDILSIGRWTTPLNGVLDSTHTLLGAYDDLLNHYREKAVSHNLCAREDMEKNVIEPLRQITHAILANTHISVRQYIEYTAQLNELAKTLKVVEQSVLTNAITPMRLG